MATTKTPSAADKAKAADIIQKQLEQGQKVLNAPSKDSKIRVSPLSFEASKKLFEANKLEFGPKPSLVGPKEIIELMASGALVREGHAKSTRYKLTQRPLDLINDPALTKKKSKAGRKPGSISASRPTSQPREPRTAVLTIGNREKEILKANIREYLSFATGVESRKHGERQQAEDVIDRIAARAKELRTEAKKAERALTPGDAMRQAQAEVDMPFETLLQVKFDPIFYSMFGVFDSGDTSQRDMR